MTSLDAPARGTRPRNRREITIEVATDQFYRDGYAQVSMSDIAEAMNVGASALYRHFPSKAELLAACISSGIDRYGEVLSAPAPDVDAPDRLHDVLRRLARCAIEYRSLGVLWQREARNLPEPLQRALREQLRATTGRLSGYLAAARDDIDAAQADVLAWCSMGVLVSIGFHSLELPRDQFVDLMFDLVSAVAALPMPLDADSDAGGIAPTADETRRDELISRATELFAERGFAATGIDDIGDAVGIAGPSVYSHFASKQVILVAAINRASELLLTDAAAVLGTDAPPRDKLARLVDSYVRLAVGDRFVLRTLLSELGQLDVEDREAARQRQREYIDEWVALVREFAPEEPIPARIRVQAVLLVVNDAMQTPHLRSRPGITTTLAQLSRVLLGISVPPTP